MINDIKEPYCSFEVSKLLKEKEFDVNMCTYRVTKDCGKYNWQREGSFLDENEFLDQTCCPNHNVGYENLIYCPTQTIAIMWIRENFRIDISSHISTSGKFMFDIYIPITKQPGDDPDGFRGWERLTGQYGFDSSEQANEAALIQTLTNIIK